MPRHRATSKLAPIQDELSLRIVLLAPPAGVDFGLQEGKGNEYNPINKQRSKGKDPNFDCVVTVKDNRSDALPNFLGPLTQGPPTGRFIYVDVGRLAGQTDCRWERRIKVPLNDISWKMIRQVSADPNLVLEARLPGTAKDGGPSCATVHPIHGWKVARQSR